MYKKILYITLFIISLSFSYVIVQAVEVPEDAEESESDDVIVEKNLFSPERKKWIMERPKEKKKEKPKKDKKKLKKIELFGTVVAGKERYAVLRTEKGRRKSKFYMVGDYISGYLIKEIDRKRVVLRDDSENEDYTIFINEGKKSRTAVKTEIKTDEPAKKPKKKSKKAVRKKKAPKPKKAKTAQFLMKRLKKDVEVLRQKDSKLVERQAKKDYEKLEKLLPHMSNKEVRKAIELKKELDRLIGE